jgi:hypothetical protein
MIAKNDGRRPAGSSLLLRPAPFSQPDMQN